MTETVLWDYPKSSASYRVRIALNMCGAPYRREMVNLLEGDHRNPDHRARNPQGFVPVLDIDGHRLTQSLAILEYLDATRGLGLLPADPALQARVRALAYVLAVDVHPICNLSVATHATGGKDPARTMWMRHFIRPGLEAFATLMDSFDGPFATGDAPSLADLCLIPQLYNAKRWGVDYTDLSGIKQVEAACAALPAFADAHPDL